MVQSKAELHHPSWVVSMACIKHWVYMLGSTFDQSHSFGGHILTKDLIINDQGSHLNFFAWVHVVGDGWPWHRHRQ